MVLSQLEVLDLGLHGADEICSLSVLLSIVACICDPLRDHPAHPAIIDFVLEAIIVTKQHFGENAVITATGQQTHGLQDIGV